MTMARSGKNTAHLIREKATELFFLKGYAGTSLREVAAASGLQIGSLYNHISSKEDLLLQVMGGVIDDLVAEQETAMATPGDAVDKLRAAVDCHVRFHAQHAPEVHIGNSNLAALSDGAREEIVRKRKDYERNIQSLVEEAGRAGLASVLDARLHTFSILGMGTHLAGWYRPEGRLSLDEIADTYTTLALRELKVIDADERVEQAAQAG
ncbi:TetR/AcrR family transcriptional regulator [Corynebacterium sp.]|uniref:TetR/AcrR family transcriptional regulator n=1 Tax=Corynebacterium sp. TaxID=1720 RepID=UPI0026DEEF76|nr:TetR/AcrR family transcriptional regulator [Corynebacterium sp.]MDO5511743.1 TetR/AcrR family transcriptional regulator [Corynebacterium sp.]